MGKQKDRKGWSLQLRGKTWFVYHRYTPDGKLIGKTTGKRDRTDALRTALDIIAEARTEVKGAGGDYYMAHINAIALKKKEEEAVLGEELDKTNPRLDILWKIATKSKDDIGVLLDWLKTNRSAQAIRTYRAVWKCLRDVNPQIFRISEVRPEHFANCIKLKQTATEKRKALTEDSLQLSFITSMRSLFKILVAEGWCPPPNPAPVPKTPKKKSAKIIQPITPEQIEQLAPLFESSGYGVLFQLGLHTGMRRSEMANLLWSDIHLDHIPRAILTVQPHDEDKGNGIVKSTLKTANSHRIVPLKKELVDYLRPLCKSSGYVLESDKHSISREFFALPGSLAKKAKGVCPGFHLHLMRHTFISRALMAGKPPVKVAMWVGDSLQIILDTYTHFIPDDSIEFD